MPSGYNLKKAKLYKKVQEKIGLRYRYVADLDQRGFPILKIVEPLMDDSLSIREKREFLFTQDLRYPMIEKIWETYIETNRIRESAIKNLMELTEGLFRSENNDAYLLFNNIII